MTVYVEIAFALVAVFLMLSLLVTTINEVIANLFKLRSKLLFRVLSNLMGGRTVSNGLWRGVITGRVLSRHTDQEQQTLLEIFLRNPLLTCDSVNIHKARMVPDDKDEPSYATQDDERKITSGSGPSFMCSSVFASGLIRAIVDFRDTSPAPSELTFEALETSVEKIQQPELKAVLLNALSRSKGSLEAVEKELEKWFDNLMDRVSGIYKRWQIYISFGVALLLAGAMNLNVIGMVAELKQDQDNLPKIELLVNGLVAKGMSEGEVSVSLTKDEIKGVSKLWSDLEVTSFGWPNPFPRCCPDDENCLWVRNFGERFLGWLIAALAATLGAPFWFDVLQKVTNVRSSGPKPKPADAAQS